jgi:hypothetical protein
MSLIKANAVQIGQSNTATQNFTLAVPSSPNGTIKLARGNSGATTQDVISVDASGNVNGLVKSTGSTTARSLANRFADVVNVRDFGAVGDGVADDTAAIQAAINSSANLIYIPAGNYNITPIVFSNFLCRNVHGAGRDITNIVLTSTGTALTFSNCQWLQLSDLSIKTVGFPQTLANSSAIQLDNGSSNCVIERVNIYGFSHDGIRIIGTFVNTASGNTVRDCYILGCKRNQIHEIYNNDSTWDNVQVGRLAGISLADIGWYRESCGEACLINIKVWDNTLGLKAVNCTATRYSSCRIEESTTQNIWHEGGYDNSFDQLRSYNGSKGSNGTYDFVYITNEIRFSLTDSNINTWNADYGRWTVNFDTGCSDITIRSNTLGGFDATNFGPVRFSGNIQTISGDAVLYFTGTSVSSSSTVYLSNGNLTSEAAAYRSVERRYAVVKLYTASALAPGAGQSFTYTLRKNSADTTMTASSSGSSSFAVSIPVTAPQILLTTGDYITPKLVTSSTATNTDHRGYIVLVSY